MGRPPCCDKSNVKRGLWTPEEDAKILAYVSAHGTGNWTLVPKKAGLNRCGKSCRLRWTNYLRPDLKHNGFTPEEEELIINSHKAIGSRWSLIAKQLPGRTDNDVKNYWNTKLSKKLRKMGIDPVTHKPFSQVVSEYENISGLVSQNVSLNSSSTPNSRSFLQVHNNHSTKMPAQGDHFSGESYTWKLMGDHQGVVQPHLCNEATSSCSSSSSTTITRMSSPQTSFIQPFQSHTTQNPPFGLISSSSANPVPVETMVHNEEGFLQRFFPSEKAFSLAEKQSMTGKESCSNQSERSEATPGDYLKTCPEVSPSSVSSFVEAILDRDRQLRAEFPEIWDGFFDY